MTKRKILIIMVCALACILGIAWLLYPLSQAPLDQEIVFHRTEESSFPVWEETTLGFIDSDGSRLELVSTGRIDNRIPYFPTWSPDGQRIAVRHHPSGLMHYPSDIGVFDLVRRRFKSPCSHAALAGQGPVRWIPDSELVVACVSQGFTQIALVNLRRCEIWRTLVDFEKDSIRVGNVDISVHNELAMNEIPTGDNLNSPIVVWNLDTWQKWQVAQGINPSWSPDGEWLAYTGQDGIHVVRRDGSEDKLVLVCLTINTREPHEHRWPPMPRWSPDGKWLVYHREPGEQPKGDVFVIYKLNVETGEEVKIIEGGLNPDWRWDLDSTSK